jgi:arylsulfatase A-like enzyme
MINNAGKLMKTLIVLFISFIFSCSILEVNGQSKRPNILVIFSDDHAQQAISAYGGKLMQTPNIDRIAREGAIFRNSFVTNSICAPSRAVFLTGKYSHLNGLIDNSPGRRFNGSQQQVQKLLGEQHYQTAWIGKWHLQSLPQGFNFWKILPDQGNYFQPDFIDMNDDTVRHQGYVTDLISDFSLDWLNHRDTASPFFLVVGEKATHRNWMPDIQDLGAFDYKEFPLPGNFFDDYKNRSAAFEQDMTISKTMILSDDLKIGVDYRGWMFGRLSTEQKQAYEAYYKKIGEEYEKIKGDSIAVIKWKFQRYLRDYLSTAKSMDRNIGRILNYLDSTGLSRNTIVIYTSDQGFYMGEHGWFDKRFMYEESLRTPLVMKYPGFIKPGTEVTGMVVNIDLAPTLLSLAGIKPPKEMQGLNFATLFKPSDNPNLWRKSLYYHYYEYPEPHRVAPHFGIRTEKYKLIRFYGPHNDWELFDMTNDPTEMKNLYVEPSYKKIRGELQKQLVQLAIQYKDTAVVKLLQ